MKTQSLNGVWKCRIGKEGSLAEREVPFSSLAVGHSECERCFDLELDGDTVYLKLDGITYNAIVFLNGEELGKMLPYCEYSFDITRIARKRNNLLRVEIEDISPAFGPTEGWENYGGIIRDVSLVYQNKAHITDVFFKTELENSYNDAFYSVEISSAGDDDSIFEITLLYDGKIIDKYRVKNGEICKRHIENIHTWSPESPNLYTLRVNMLKNGRLSDTYECTVGFCELKCERHRFVLNGKPLFIKGVCKHEMYGDSGHTVSEWQIEKDLKMIKEMGCNFVRLVHYPHNKKTLEIADRLGLMVSEEPGLWQSDTTNPEVSTACLEVLRRTVIRDRNHPSIIFWLCFNECDFSEQFLKDAVRVCRENDGTRLVSGANNMNDADTLKYYNLCGLDFYTTHPYSDTFNLALSSARALNDKPLMFTEWGGYYVYDNPHLLTDFLNGMYELYKANSDEGALAGECFWYFAEINDFDRGGSACVDGALKEALVDIDRNPTMIYSAFCNALRAMEQEPKYTDLYEYNAYAQLDKSSLCSNDAPSKERLLELCKSPPYTRLAKTRKRTVIAGPVLQKEEIKGISTVPYVLSNGNELVFEGEAQGELTVIGMVSVSGGYPVFGDYGEVAGEIILEYTDGCRQIREIRNGIELTYAYSCLGSSRIEPYAKELTRFAKFSYDKNFENYIINRLDISLPCGKTLKRITFKGKSSMYDILIYGVFK